VTTYDPDLPFIEGRPTWNDSRNVPAFGSTPVAFSPDAGVSYTFSYDESSNIITFGFTGNAAGLPIHAAAVYRESGLWHGENHGSSGNLSLDAEQLQAGSGDNYPHTDTDYVSYERIPSNGAYGPLVGVIWYRYTTDPHPTLGIATGDWVTDDGADRHIHVLHTVGQVFQATDRAKLIYDDFNRPDANVLTKSTSNHTWLCWPAILADVVLPGFVAQTDPIASVNSHIRNGHWQANGNGPAFLAAPTADVDLVATWGIPPASTVVRSKGDVFHGTLRLQDPTTGLPSTAGRHEGDLHFSDITYRDYVLRSGAWVLNTTPGGSFAGIIFRAEQIDPDVPGMFACWWARDDRVMYFRKRPDLPPFPGGGMRFDEVPFYYSSTGWTDPTPDTLPTSVARRRFVPGDRMRVSLDGNKVQVYRNGALMVTVHDSHYQTNTRHGLAGQTSSNMQFDDFWILYANQATPSFDAPPPPEQSDLNARTRATRLYYE